jgi:hydrogenase-4 component B
VTALGTVLASALCLLAAAGTVDLAVGARRARWRTVPYLAGVVASGCLVVAGAGTLAGHPARLTVAGWLGAGTAGLVADRLSGLFLIITFAAAVPVSLAFAGWAARPGSVSRRGLGASYALTLGAVAVIMTAADAFTSSWPGSC